MIANNYLHLSEDAVSVTTLKPRTLHTDNQLKYMNLLTTLSVNETFLEMLMDCKKRGAKAEMILDIDGLERAEGVILHIYTDDPTLTLN
jgi:hypothetical protein